MTRGVCIPAAGGLPLLKILPLSSFFPLRLFPKYPVPAVPVSLTWHRYYFFHVRPVANMRFFYAVRALFGLYAPFVLSTAKRRIKRLMVLLLCVCCRRAFFSLKSFCHFGSRAIQGFQI